MYIWVVLDENDDYNSHDNKDENGDDKSNLCNIIQLLRHTSTFDLLPLLAMAL